VTIRKLLTRCGAEMPLASVCRESCPDRGWDINLARACAA